MICNFLNEVMMKKFFFCCLTNSFFLNSLKCYLQKSLYHNEKIMNWSCTWSCLSVEDLLGSTCCRGTWHHRKGFLWQCIQPTQHPGAERWCRMWWNEALHSGRHKAISSWYDPFTFTEARSWKILKILNGEKCPITHKLWAETVSSGW